MVYTINTGDFQLFRDMEIVVFRMLPVDKLNSGVYFLAVDKFSHTNAEHQLIVETFVSDG